ncbi:hypothetical protein [Streptomyces sp. NPDC004682]
MYATRDGRGYQLLLSGHRQYNVKWMYGQDSVIVEVCDHHENPGSGFTELKRVSIPGDYKGKYWQEIVSGMDEHMMHIARKLTREWEGEGCMTEFRDEWAMHKWHQGQKVSYQSVRGGTVLGVVVGTERRGTARDVLVRVTSRKNPLYRCGEVVPFSTTDQWLKKR